MHELVAGLLGDRPVVLPGTPAWRSLPDTHPDKWAALLWAAVWWCLEQDARQDALADASKQVAASDDWAAVARRIRAGRGPAYIPRKRSA